MDLISLVTTFRPLLDQFLFRLQFLFPNSQVKYLIFDQIKYHLTHLYETMFEVSLKKWSYGLVKSFSRSL